MTDLFVFAEEQAQRGMTLALEHAERQEPEWGDQAFTFLQDFARRTPTFISEDVSDESKARDFPQPPTDRAWGAIYRRALKRGVITQYGMGRSRRRHGSVCPRWRSKIFEG